MICPSSAVIEERIGISRERSGRREGEGSSDLSISLAYGLDEFHGLGFRAEITVNLMSAAESHARCVKSTWNIFCWTIESRSFFL